MQQHLKRTAGWNIYQEPCQDAVYNNLIIGIWNIVSHAVNPNRFGAGDDVGQMVRINAVDSGNRCY
jgi:hypothetical protein